VALVRGVIVLGGGWLRSRTAGVVIAERTSRDFPRYAPLSPAGPPLPFARTAAEEKCIDLGWYNGTLPPADTEVWVGADGVSFVLLTTLPLGTQSYRHNTGAFGVRRYYKLRHTNVTDVSDFSFVVSAVSGVDVPDAAPSNLFLLTPPGRPQGETTLVASWTSGDATAQTVVMYRPVGGTYQNAAPTAAAGATSYTLTGLTPNTVYEVYLYHTKSGVSSGASNAAQGTTLVDGPDAPPSSLTATRGAATLAGERRIDLAWTNGDPTSPTEVYVSTTGAAGSFTLLTPVGAGVAAYSHDTGAYNVQRWYYVRHVKNAVPSSVSNTATAFSGLDVPNAAPSSFALTQLTLRPAGETQLSVAWVNGDATAQTVVLARKLNTGSFAQVAAAAPGVTSVVIGSLTPNTVYEGYAYHVKSSVASANSNAAQGTTLVDGPDAPPSSLTATHTGGGVVSLAWVSGDVTAQTQVFRNGTLIATVGAGVASAEDTQAAGAAVSYQVRHSKNAVVSGFSNTAALTVPTVPQPPTGLTVDGLGSAFALHWTSGDATAQTEVYCSINGGAFVAVATLSAGITSWTDSGGYAQDTEGYYTLRHTRDGFVSDNAVAVRAYTYDLVDAPPSSLTTSSITYKSATLSWVNGDPSCVSDVYYRLVGGTEWTLITTVATGVTQLSIAGLTAETAYEWFVLHRKTDRGGRTWTLNSNTASFPTAVLPYPVGVSATHRGSGDNQLGGDFALTWSNASPELSVRVQAVVQGAAYGEFFYGAGSSSVTLDLNVPPGSLVAFLMRHELGSKVSVWVTYHAGTTPASPGAMNWDNQGYDGVDSTNVIWNWVRENDYADSMLRISRNGVVVRDWFFVSQTETFYYHPHSGVVGAYTCEIYKFYGGYRSAIINRSFSAGPAAAPSNLRANDTSWCETMGDPGGGSGLSTPLTEPHYWVQLLWANGDSGAVVELYREGSLYQTFSAGTTSYIDTFVFGGEHHSYTVRHVKNGIPSTFSNVAGITLINPCGTTGGGGDGGDGGGGRAPFEAI
jgi:hypothetical protein